MIRRIPLVLATTAAAVAALVLAALPAPAASSGNIVTVQATVAARCFVGSTSLSFGAYDPSAAGPLDISGSIGLICTKGSQWVLGLDQGASTLATRNMIGAVGGNALHYELYTDSSGGTPWTNGTAAGPGVVSGTAGNVITLQFVPIYARLFAGQYVTATTYSDTVKATLNF
jgi:spore coat protein U-like protein